MSATPVRDRLLDAAPSGIAKTIVARWPEKMTAEERRIRTVTLLEAVVATEGARP